MYKVAAIDVGTSATRLSVLHVAPNGGLVHTYLKRFEMRLGTDVFTSGQVGPEKQAQLVALFVEIAAYFKKNRIQRYRAVATSAMRDAQNALAVVQAILQASGLRLQVISGAEEGALSKRALLAALGNAHQDALLVDLGGGSLELECTKPAQSLSAPLGTVRLLHLFPNLQQALAPDELASIRQAIDAQLVEHSPHFGMYQTALAVGTGGNLELIAKKLGVSEKKMPQFEAQHMATLVHELAAMTVAQRAEKYGLRQDRADLFLPAVLVLHTVAQRFGVQRFAVPRTGLRESILRDLLTPMAHQRMRMAQDPHSTRQAVALELFEILTPLHHLWPPAERILIAVAELYADKSSKRPAISEDKLVQVAQKHALQRSQMPIFRQACAALQLIEKKHADKWPAALVGLLVELADARVAQGLANTEHAILDLLSDPPVLRLGFAPKPESIHRLEQILRMRLRVC